MNRIPLSLLAVAALAQALTPFWAVSVLDQPFIGALLEPTLVVSATSGAGWPAREAGVDSPQQLIAVDDQPVRTSAELRAALGPAPHAVRLTLANRDGATVEVTITAIRFGWPDFTSLFVVPWSVGLAFLAVGVWVYRLRGDSIEGRVFLNFCAAVSILTTTFFDMASTHHAGWLWGASIPAAGAAIFHLALVFPTMTPPVRRWPILRFAPWLPGGALAVASAISLYEPSDPRAYFAPWRYDYLFVGLGLLAFLASLAYRLWLSDSPMIRQQSRIIIFGTALAFGPAMFYLVPAAFGIPSRFLAAVYFPFFVVFPLAVGYAILRYRLLDVDRVLSRGVTYGLMTAVVAAAYLILLNLTSLGLGRAVMANNPIAVSLLVFALALGFNVLRDRAQRVVDRVFYRERVDYRKELAAFSRELTRTLDLSTVLRALRDRIDEALRPSAQSL